MDLRLGGNTFRDVQIPLLWGQRAILQDRRGRLSVINLSGGRARLEILADEPADGVTYSPRVDGFAVLDKKRELYSYDPGKRILTSISLDLPECQVAGSALRIGTNQFTGNVVSGFAVGIAVTSGGMAVGAPLPSGLGKLVV